MHSIVSLALLIFSIAFILYVNSKIKKRKPVVAPPIKTIQTILGKEVQYFSKLSTSEKLRFTNEVNDFLKGVRITGVGTDVTEVDQVLVAASGIIPIFAFPNWKYPNLNEVLIYSDDFNEAFEQHGNAANRKIMGMVGDGAMNRIMILSKSALRAGFSNKTDKENTAIHEFVHLMDKTDGAIDGIPELLLGKAYVKPWLELMLKEIAAIKKNKSDINPYGTTNQAEFFAVAAEYFFERPQLFQEKHPELYAMLEKIFRQDLTK
jgi:Mlc titration factor MtfA (ptsG expression regulator)